MSGDEVNFELFNLLSGLSENAPQLGPNLSETAILQDAKFIYDNSIDVAIDFAGTKKAATTIWADMQTKKYSTGAWSEHELHPKAHDESTVNFIFTMDLLNFSFWPEEPSEEGFAVDFRGKRWKGYWSLVATLQRAIDEGIPITDSNFWQDRNECTDDVLKHVFRSSTLASIPLLGDRIFCLRQAGKVLYEEFGCRFATCIEEAQGSAARLVNLIVQRFPCFRDDAFFEGKVVHFYKRAQILVADLWACFDGRKYGQFGDINKITMFADYRIPQVLCSLGCLQYSPTLNHHIKQLKQIESGHPWEIQLRGCSIWCVELIRRQILLKNPKANINAILIDFFLYDNVQILETQGQHLIPHHRTRSIWY